MQTKLKVLHVVTEMNQGGWQNYIMNIFRNVPKKYVTFDFLVFKKGIGFFENEIGQLGGKVYHSSFGNDLNIFKLRYFLKRILKNNKYDVIHCHQRHYTYFCYKIFKKYCKTVVIHSHSASREKSLKGYLIWKLGQFVAKKSTNNLACSNNAGEFVFGKNNFIVAPNCIDSKKFIFNEMDRNKLKQKFNLNANDIVLGHIGRFSKVKNHQFMLKLIKDLNIQNDGKSKLFLCGDGTLKEQVSNQIKDDRILQKSVRILESGETNKYYSMFDFFLLPSLYEGFPLVLLESQASGCISFVSDVISNEVKLTDSIKFLNIDSVEAWAKEIQSTKVNDYATRKRCFEFIFNSIYDVSNASLFLLRYYERCLKENHD